MKRDFLKNLGIEDKTIIDAILDENSADIGRAKGELQTYKDKVNELEGKITTKDGEIATLQQKVGDTEALNNQIAQLTTDKTNLTNELNTKVTQIKKDHAIEGRIRDRKGKNVKAIKALLDNEVIFEGSEKLLAFNVYNARYYDNYIISRYFVMYGNEDNPIVKYGDFVIKTSIEGIIDKIYNIK
jgi:hypothetical protein